MTNWSATSLTAWSLQRELGQPGVARWGHEAKTHLPRLIDEVSRGASFTITRHGVPVARLVPLEAPDGAALAREIREFRRGRKGIGEVVALKEMGRR